MSEAKMVAAKQWSSLKELSNVPKEMHILSTQQMNEKILQVMHIPILTHSPLSHNAAALQYGKDNNCTSVVYLCSSGYKRETKLNSCGACPCPWLLHSCSVPKMTNAATFWIDRTPTWMSWLTRSEFHLSMASLLFIKQVGLHGPSLEEWHHIGEALTYCNHKLSVPSH